MRIRWHPAFAAALLASAAAGLSLSTTAFALEVSATAAPAPGSAQRRAILDALRPSIEAQIGPDVEFVVREIRVVGGWAFVAADPQRRGGGKIDGHHYFPHFDDMGGLSVTALLRYQNRRWNLVEQAIGATDVWFCDHGPPGLTPSCSGR
jgi:hypothetical protein